MHRQTLRRSDLSKNGRGFTLIEVMVSIVILMIGLLGLFQVNNLALDRNIENQLRQKAVVVAEQEMNSLKARPFTNITGVDIRSSVRVASGSVFRNISVQRRVADLAASNSNTKQVSIRVWWRYRGRPYEHQTVSGIGSSELSSRY